MLGPFKNYYVGGVKAYRGGTQILPFVKEGYPNVANLMTLLNLINLPF